MKSSFTYLCLFFTLLLSISAHSMELKLSPGESESIKIGRKRLNVSCSKVVDPETDHICYSDIFNDEGLLQYKVSIYDGNGEKVRSYGYFGSQEAADNRIAELKSLGLCY